MNTSQDLTIAMTYMTYSGKRTIQLYDANGRLVSAEVLAATSPTSSIKIKPGLIPGNYFLRIQSTEQTYTCKLVIPD